MCGIAGIFHRVESEAPITASEHSVLEQMAAALAHRGPDEQGIHCQDGWGLVSRRLAIIGVATGHQPLPNEDRTVWVAFNGEIYNHRALRAQLERAGHVLATDADTEVLVHLYEEYGTGMLGRLEGMFAFALVDVPKRRLLLARDRLGQKPLFYCATPRGDVAFASELAALLRHPHVPTEENAQALHDYLSLAYVPAPDTILKDVHKLPPACSVVFDCPEHGLPEPERYWRPAYDEKHSLTFAQASEQLHDILTDAVRKRLESEVPLGAFLSGGLDSSIVVSTMQRLMSQPVRTFTIGFENAAYDERTYARAVAEHVGSTHRAKVCEPRDLDLVRTLVRHYGEPFSDSSMLPTALLSQFTAEHVTVALSGDGGDEVFGGYKRYQVMALMRVVQMAPERWRDTLCRLLLKALPEAVEQRSALATVRRILTAFRYGDERSYATFQGIFSEEAKRQLTGAAPAGSAVFRVLGHWQDVLQQGTARDFVERFMELDLLSYLPGDLLCKVDIASMLFSLEVRCPFLDHRVVEFAAALPRSFKVGMTGRKRVLAACAGTQLPPAVSGRGKMGFGVPVSQWFREEWQDVIPDMLGLDADRCAGSLRTKAVRRLVQEHAVGAADHGSRLWALLCYGLWRQQFLP